MSRDCRVVWERQGCRVGAHAQLLRETVRAREGKMECELSGNQIKSLNRAVNCLYRIGSELLIEVLPDKVSMRLLFFPFQVSNVIQHGLLLQQACSIT